MGKDAFTMDNGRLSFPDRRARPVGYRLVYASFHQRPHPPNEPSASLHDSRFLDRGGEMLCVEESRNVSREGERSPPPPASRSTASN